MAPVHFKVPRLLLLLLHATAAAAIGEALNTTTDIQTVTDGVATESETTTNRPGKTTTAIPEGASHPPVPPTVRLYCLERGTKVLYCDAGPHEATFIQWTLDRRPLTETHAFFQHNNRTITLATGVLGDFSCKVGHVTSLPVKPACEGDTWLFYSAIMAAAGGGAFLLSLIVCAVACCCRRRTHRLPLKQEEFELGTVYTDVKIKPKVQEVHEVAETTPINTKTTPNMDSAEDGFQFPTPPDMDDLTTEQHGKATAEDGQNTSAAGSEDSSADDHEDKIADNESNGDHGN